MNLDIIGYIFIYIFYSLFCLIWLKKTFLIKLSPIYLVSLLANLSFLSLLSIVYLISLSFSNNVFINYLLSFIAIFIISVLIRQKLLRRNMIKDPSRTLLEYIYKSFIERKSENNNDLNLILWKKDELSGKSKKVYLIGQATSLMFGLFILAGQYSNPKFGWDSVIYWVPRMKEVALGNFMSSLNLGFPSYPPLWIIIGSHALQINSNFLYLLPVFLITHLLLAVGDFLVSLPGKKFILYFYPIFLGSIMNIFFSIYSLELYANFIVAIFLSMAFFIDKYLKETRVKILITILMAGAVLCRPEAIVFVGLWFLAKLIQLYRMKQKTEIKQFIQGGAIILLAYFGWIIFCFTNNIQNPIITYLVQGIGQIESNYTLVFTKASDIFEYNLKIMAFDQVYWFVPFYIIFALIISRSRFWLVVNLLCFAYLFFEYLTVPIMGKSDMKWWLETGYLRMFGIFSLWIMLDFLVKLNDAMQISEGTFKRLLIKRK